MRKRGRWGVRLSWEEPKLGGKKRGIEVEEGGGTAEDDANQGSRVGRKWKEGDR